MLWLGQIFWRPQEESLIASWTFVRVAVANVLFFCLFEENKTF